MSKKKSKVVSAPKAKKLGEGQFHKVLELGLVLGADNKTYIKVYRQSHRGMEFGRVGKKDPKVSKRIVDATGWDAKKGNVFVAKNGIALISSHSPEWREKAGVMFVRGEFGVLDNVKNEIKAADWVKVMDAAAEYNEAVFARRKPVKVTILTTDEQMKKARAVTNGCTVLDILTGAKK